MTIIDYKQVANGKKKIDVVILRTCMKELQL